MVDVLFLVLWGIIFIGAIIALVIWLVLRSYPFKIRIRELTSTNVRLIHDTLGKIKKDDDKIEYLGLMNKNIGHSFLPLPQPEVVDYDPKKKKKIVEVYYSDEIGYVYIKDGKDIKDMEGKDCQFDPVTTKQRAMIINQLKKKEARKTTSWTQNIPLIVGAVTIVLLVTIILIFWGEAMQPMMEVGGMIDSVTGKLDAIAEKLLMAERGQQFIPSTPPI